MTGNSLDLINQQIQVLNSEVILLDGEISNLEQDRRRKESLLRSPRFKSSNQKQIADHVQETIEGIDSKIDGFTQNRDRHMQEYINLILQKALLKSQNNSNKGNNANSTDSDASDSDSSSSKLGLDELYDKIKNIMSDLKSDDQEISDEDIKKIEQILASFSESEIPNLNLQDLTFLKRRIGQEIQNKKDRLIKKHSKKTLYSLFKKEKDQDRANESNKKISGKFTESYLKENSMDNNSISKN